MFLDPPFDSDLLQPALETLSAGPLLAAQSRVYVEYPPGYALPAATSGWRLHREGRSPHTAYALFLT